MSQVMVALFEPGVPDETLVIVGAEVSTLKSTEVSGLAPKETQAECSPVVEFLARACQCLLPSLKLEKVMNKDQILTTYLNEAPYGGNIYGIEEASKSFFGKKPFLWKLLKA